VQAEDGGHLGRRERLVGVEDVPVDAAPRAVAEDVAEAIEAGGVAVG
jgi:hypothetical protein